TGIRQHAAEAHTGRDDTIDLCQSQLRLRPRRSTFGWNTRSLQPSSIARPALGKKQSQPQHDRYFAARKRQRYKGLAIGGLAQRRSILRYTHRMRAFLGIAVSSITSTASSPPKPICLDKQFCFHWRCIPDLGGNEVVQLVAFAQRNRFAIG